MKRILMTADTVGGVWTYALELSRALREYDLEIELAIMGPPLSADQRRSAGKIDNVNLHERPCKLEWMEEPWEDVDAAGKWLLDLQSRLNPDCVHLNGYAHGALQWEIPAMIVGHSCVFSWYAAVKGHTPAIAGNRYYQAALAGLRCCNAVTAPTNAMLNALRFHYGPFPAAPVVYNGRDAADFPPLDKKNFIFSAGRLWDEAKNMAALSRIAEQVSWPVFAAGEMKHPEGGDRRLEQVSCLGVLPPEVVAEWMGHASIYVLAARYEPFGLSVLEAALAQCALILGDIATLHELWDGAAVFVPCDDADSLCAAVTMLINDYDLRTSLAAKARRRALRLTPRRMAEGYFDLYTSLTTDVTNKAREIAA
jgi:glycosyltransferase involved in cell wall biosynthesis